MRATTLALLALLACFVALALILFRDADAQECIGAGTLEVQARVHDEDTYAFNLCPDPSHNLGVWLNWGNARKDLALILASPSGVVYAEDSHGGFFESALVPSPVEQGIWTVEVSNNGNGNVSYDLTLGIGY